MAIPGDDNAPRFAGKDCSAIRAEFFGLCAAARCRVPLFRGPEVLSSRRTLLRARDRDRSGKELSRGSFATWQRRYPADKIQEALKRLIDRRYVVVKRGSSASVAASYWASLGLPPGIAEKNLQKMPRAHRIDRRQRRKGTRRRIDASSAFASCKRSADLTVTLVNDYLEARLAELNRQHLSDDTPWLLVQPSGIFPLVGPVFSPGKGACWTCLAERMKRNREVKALLDRKQARRVAASPLARDTLGQSAIQLAAIEIAKAIATDFRTRVARSHHQPRSAGLDHREALRGGPAAMSGLRQQEAARSAPRAGADRACRRRQTDHDQRGISGRFVEGHGGAFPQACKPADRRGLAARTDRSRFAAEHQLSMPRTISRRPPRRSTSFGPD